MVRSTRYAYPTSISSPLLSGDILTSQYCWNSSRGWYAGELNGQYRAASYSSIAASAYSFESGRLRHILLYYQAAGTNEICELIKNGWNSWTEGTRHPAGIKGTSIAADSRPDGARIWYQLPDTTFIQYGFESGQPWKKGTVISLPVDVGSNRSTGDFVSTAEHDQGASIAVSNRYKVLTVAKGNKLALTVFNEKTGQWEPTKLLIDQLPSTSLAAISHPKHYGNTFTSTVYTQQRPGEITKVQFNWDNTWEESLLPVKL